MSGAGMNLAGCASCKGQCCRAYLVVVNATDVRKIVEATSLRPSDFIYLSERKDTEPGFRLRPGGRGHHLALQKKDGKGSACVFLVELAPSVARCGMYAHRPRVCSTFPAKLAKGVVDIRQDTTCGPNAWNVSAMDLPDYRRDLTSQRTDWQDHWRLVMKWNGEVDADGRARTPDDLFGYLLQPRVAPETASRAAVPG